MKQCPKCGTKYSEKFPTTCWCGQLLNEDAPLSDTDEISVKVQNEHISGNNDSLSDGRHKSIDNSLENIQLGTPISNLTNDSKWEEVTGPEKDMFGPVSSGERLFITSYGTPIMCGCIFGKVYKISVMVPPAMSNVYIDEFVEKYGQATKPRRGCHIWEDDNVALEVILGGPQTNIILTNKQLLLKGFGS